MEQNRVAIMILQNERPYLAERPEFAYIGPLERDIERVWHDTLRRGIEAGEFRADLDVMLTYRFIRDVLFTAALVQLGCVDRDRRRPAGRGVPVAHPARAQPVSRGASSARIG